MNNYITKLIGIIEFLIGIITIYACVVALEMNFYAKPLSVTIFVIGSSLASIFLGINLLRLKRFAIKLMVIFSFYILVTKVLIFAGLLVFTGDIQSFMPIATKDTISFIYHLVALVFFYRVLKTQ